jgi:dihydropteroate synthase
VREAERHVDRVGGAAGAAETAVARAYRGEGLDAEARERLAETGVTVTGDDPAVVAGTAAALRAAGRALSDENGVLGALAATLRAAGT